MRGQALISAVGLFNQPNLPDIPGIETFAGRMFHTTAWDHAYDYVGKRVAVIGTGSTGSQLARGVAEKAASYDVRRLERATRSYGNVQTKKFFANALKPAAALHAN